MRMMEVLNSYKNDEPHIELNVGDVVLLGEDSCADGLYPNWVFCTSERTGRKGWVSKHIFSEESGRGIVMENYTSKEMAVKAGDKVTAVYELNGWYWCVRKADGERGWVAKDNLN